jgi:hypothetical protein
MRTVVLIALATMTACASGKTPLPVSAAPQADGVPPDIDPRVSSGVPLVPRALPAPPDLVWKVLPSAYDSLGIRLSVIDPDRHLIGNQGMKLRQKLGTTRLSKYIGCGSTQIGPSADSYDVLLSVITDLSITAEGATGMSTRVSAAARPLAFSQEYSRCVSTGEIEKRLFELVTARLKTGH